MSKKILVTGATGKVATSMYPFLAGKNLDVRGLVRNPAKAADLAKHGVKAVEGDLERPRTLDRAFEGAEIVLVIAPPGPRAPEQCSNALWAARKAGAKRVVRLSAWGAAHDAPTVNSRLHALSDAELERSNVPYTILKPHFFMQNLMMAMESVMKEGKMYFALGNGRLGMIDAQDIGEVAAHVLTTDGHEGKTYGLTGPKAITMHDVATAFGEALGKKVEYVPLPVQAVDDTLAKMGVDEWMRTALTDYFTAYSNDWAPTANDEVKRLLGHPARSILDFAKSLFAH